MNTLKTIPGNQALYAGMIFALPLTVTTGANHRLATFTNPFSGDVKNIVVNLTEGDVACEFVSGDDVTDGSADGYYVQAPAAPGLLATPTQGTFEGVTDMTYDLDTEPKRDATAVALVLSEIQGMRGTTVADLLDSVPNATHVAWRWDGDGDLAIKPVGGTEGDHADWPTIAAESEGVWHVDTLRSLTVRNLGASTAKLHLMLLAEQGGAR